MKWLQVLLFNINYSIQHNSLICDTMWVVRQADDPFVCFGAKPNKGLGFEISDETGSGGGEARSMRSQRAVGNGTQSGLVGEGRRREAVDNG